MNDPACRPALAEAAPDLSQYGAVFLGFPIWWYVEPRIVDTFLDACSLSGKRVIPFATSGGSGIEKAAKNLQAHYPQAPGPRAAWCTGKPPPPGQRARFQNKRLPWLCGLGLSWAFDGAQRNAYNRQRTAGAALCPAA